jgi:hypothetical protein
MFAAVTGSSYMDLAIAMVGVVGLYVQNRRTSKKVSAVQEDIATNHGRKPFEYLEMVADLKEDMAEARIRTANIHTLLVDQRRMLEEHTAQDEKNFTELKDLIGGDDK